MIKIIKFIIVLLLFTIVPYFIGSYMICAVWFMQYMLGLLVECLILTIILGFIGMLISLNIV